MNSRRLLRVYIEINKLLLSTFCCLQAHTKSWNTNICGWFKHGFYGERPSFREQILRGRTVTKIIASSINTQHGYYDSLLLFYLPAAASLLLFSLLLSLLFMPPWLKTLVLTLFIPADGQRGCWPLPLLMKFSNTPAPMPCKWALSQPPVTPGCPAVTSWRISGLQATREVHSVFRKDTKYSLALKALKVEEKGSEEIQTKLYKLD